MSKRPFVLASFAQTLDGALSTADSKPLAISGPLSRILTHALRGRLDAILVGIGTVLADDPALNCRVAELAGNWQGLIFGHGDTSGLPRCPPRVLLNLPPGVPPYRQPHRIVLDPRLELPEQARMLDGILHAPVTIFYNPGLASQPRADESRSGKPQAGRAMSDKTARLVSRGVRLMPTAGLRASWSEILEYVQETGLGSLFIEGGRRVLATVLEEGHVDALILTQAPLIQGGSASWYPEEVPRGFTLASVLRAGDDLVMEYVPTYPPSPAPLTSPAGLTLPGSLDIASGGPVANAPQQAPYLSLALLAAELGVPGLEPLVPLSAASRLFLTGPNGPAAGTGGTGSPALSLDEKKPETRTDVLTPEYRQLVFTGPLKVGMRKLRLEPGPDELVVESRLMGISAGTELAVFRGECRDFSGESLPGLQPAGYPLAYGYINVGQAPDGSRVFGFAAHQDRFCARTSDLIQLGRLSWDDAVFLPSMETALGIVHDAHPRLGDKYCVAGQGIVGLLVTRILVSMGVGVMSLETSEFRRRISREAGALSLDPGDSGLPADLARLTGGNGWDRAINCSGSEAALQVLIDHAPSDSTIIEASWYADRRVSLGLGQAFHRKRLRIASSQVSFLGPALGRSWTKARRFAVVLDLLDRLRPSTYISHRFSMEGADKAYAVLSTPGAEVLQIVIDPSL